MAEKANAAGAKATGGELKFDLTPIDAKFFVTMAKYLPKAIEMDWEAFASDLGLKSAVVAKVRLYFLQCSLFTNRSFIGSTLRKNMHILTSLRFPIGPLPPNPRQARPQ